MKNCFPALVLLLAVFMMSLRPSQASALSQTQSQIAEGKPRFALLVGISKYDSKKGFSPLEGPLNDVVDVKNALVRDFGFRPENILILTNEAATRRGIVSAIRSQLREHARAHPDGTFLFYYSGHGSQTHDVNGDEKLADPSDTDDETLVPFDSTRDANDHQHFDLVDDDLERLFGEIRSLNGFTGSLTAILDCCYSGTATRAGIEQREESQFPRSRQAVPDPRSYPPDGLVSDLPRGSMKRGSFAAFSACLDTETSEEDAFPELMKGQEKRRAHGVMTYYLLQAMQNATSTTTNSQIWSQIARGLVGHYQQNPQLEERGLQKFLGGATQEQAPTIPYILTGRTLKFERGVEAGAVPGGFVALYGAPPKAKGAASLRQLQITRVRLGESEIILPATQGIPSTGAVRLLTPFFGSKTLIVGLGANVSADNPVAKKLAEFYNRSTSLQIRFAQPGERPDVILNLSSYPLTRSTTAETLADNTEASLRGYTLSLGNGSAPLFDVVVIAKSNDDIEADGIARLQGTLENYVVQSRVLALSNDLAEGQSLEQAVKIRAYRVQGRTDSEGNWYSFKDTKARTPLSISQRMKLSVNEGVQFEFENQTYKTLHVALLWLSQDGSVTAMEFQDSTKVAVLKSKGNPGAKASTDKYGVVLPTKQSIVLPQGGAENIKIFVSTQPIDVYYLERNPVTRLAKNPESMLSPFDVIAGEVIGTRAAIKKSDPIDFRTWATMTLGLSIVKR